MANNQITLDELCQVYAAVLGNVDADEITKKQRITNLNIDQEKLKPLKTIYNLVDNEENDKLFDAIKAAQPQSGALNSAAFQGDEEDKKANIITMLDLALKKTIEDRIALVVDENQMLAAQLELYELGGLTNKYEHLDQIIYHDKIIEQPWIAGADQVEKSTNTKNFISNLRKVLLENPSDSALCNQANYKLSELIKNNQTIDVGIKNAVDARIKASPISNFGDSSDKLTSLNDLPEAVQKDSVAAINAVKGLGVDYTTDATKTVTAGIAECLSSPSLNILALLDGDTNTKLTNLNTYDSAPTRADVSSWDKVKTELGKIDATSLGLDKLNEKINGLLGNTGLDMKKPEDQFVFTTMVELGKRKKDSSSDLENADYKAIKPQQSSFIGNFFNRSSSNPYGAFSNVNNADNLISVLKAIHALNNCTPSYSIKDFSSSDKIVGAIKKHLATNPPGANDATQFTYLKDYGIISEAQKNEIDNLRVSNISLNKFKEISIAINGNVSLVGSLQKLNLSTTITDFSTKNASDIKNDLNDLIKNTPIATLNQITDLLKIPAFENEKKALDNIKRLEGRALDPLKKLSEAVQACLASPSLSILALLDPETNTKLNDLNTYDNTVNRLEVDTWQKVQTQLGNIATDSLGLGELNTKINKLLGTKGLDMQKPDDRFVFTTMVEKGLKISGKKIEYNGYKELNGNNNVKESIENIFASNSSQIIPGLKAIYALNKSNPLYSIEDFSSSDKIVGAIKTHLATNPPGTDDNKQFEMLKTQKIISEEQFNDIQKTIEDKKITDKLNQISTVINGNESLVESLQKLNLSTTISDFSSKAANDIKTELNGLIKNTQISTLNQITDLLALPAFENEKKALENIISLGDRALDSSKNLSEAVQAYLESPSLNILALLDGDTNTNLIALKNYDNALPRADVSSWDKVKTELGKIDATSLGLGKLNTKINELLGTTDLDMQRSEDQFVFTTMVNNGLKVNSDNLELLNTTTLQGGLNTNITEKKPIFNEKPEELIPYLKAISHFKKETNNPITWDLSNSDNLRESIVTYLQSRTTNITEDETRALNQLNSSLFSEDKKIKLDLSTISKDNLATTFNQIQKIKPEKNKGNMSVILPEVLVDLKTLFGIKSDDGSNILLNKKIRDEFNILYPKNIWGTHQQGTQFTPEDVKKVLLKNYHNTLDNQDLGVKLDAIFGGDSFGNETALRDRAKRILGAPDDKNPEHVKTVIDVLKLISSTDIFNNANDFKSKLKKQVEQWAGQDFQTLARKITYKQWDENLEKLKKISGFEQIVKPTDVKNSIGKILDILSWEHDATTDGKDSLNAICDKLIAPEKIAYVVTKEQFNLIKAQLDKIGMAKEPLDSYAHYVENLFKKSDEIQNYIKSQLERELKMAQEDKKTLNDKGFKGYLKLVMPEFREIIATHFGIKADDKLFFSDEYNKVNEIFGGLVTEADKKEKFLHSLVAIGLGNTTLTSSDGYVAKGLGIVQAFNNQLLADLKENKTTIAKDNHENLKAYSIINPNNLSSPPSNKDIFTVIREISGSYSDLDDLKVNYPIIGEFVDNVNDKITAPLTLDLLQGDMSSLFVHISKNLIGSNPKGKLDNLIRLDAAVNMEKFSEITYKNKKLSEYKEAYSTIAGRLFESNSSNSFTDSLQLKNQEALLNPQNYTDETIKTNIKEAQKLLNNQIMPPPPPQPQPVNNGASPSLPPPPPINTAPVYSLVLIQSTLMESVNQLIGNRSDYNEIPVDTPLRNFLKPFESMTPSVGIDSIKNGSYLQDIKGLTQENDIQAIKKQLNLSRDFFTQNVDINFVLKKADKIVAVPNKSIEQSTLEKIGYRADKIDDPSEIIKNIKKAVYTKLSDLEMYKPEKSQELAQLREAIVSINSVMSPQNISNTTSINGIDGIIASKPNLSLYLQVFTAKCLLGDQSTTDWMNQNGIKYGTCGDLFNLQSQLANKLIEGKVPFGELKTQLGMTDNTEFQKLIIKPILFAMTNKIPKLSGLDLINELAKIDGFKTLTFAELEDLINHEETPVSEYKPILDFIKNLKEIDSDAYKTKWNTEHKKYNIMKSGLEWDDYSKDRANLGVKLLDLEIGASEINTQIKAKINVFNKWAEQKNASDVPAPLARSMVYFADNGLLKEKRKEDIQSRFQYAASIPKIDEVMKSQNILDQTLTTLTDNPAASLFTIQQKMESTTDENELKKLQLMERAIENKSVLDLYKDGYTNTFQALQESVNALETNNPIKAFVPLELVRSQIKPSSVPANNEYKENIKDMILSLQPSDVVDPNFKLYDVVYEKLRENLNNNATASGQAVVHLAPEQVQANINKEFQELYEGIKEDFLQKYEELKQSQGNNTLQLESAQIKEKDAIEQFYSYQKLKQSYDSVKARVHDVGQEYTSIKLAAGLELQGVTKPRDVGGTAAENSIPSDKKIMPVVLDSKNALSLKCGAGTMTITVDEKTQNVSFTTAKSETDKTSEARGFLNPLRLINAMKITSKLDNMLVDEKTRDGIYHVAQSYMMNWKPGDTPRLKAESPEEMKMLLMNMYLINNQFKKTIPAFQEFPFDKIEMEIKGLSKLQCREIKDQFLTYQKYITKDSKGDFRHIHDKLRLDPDQKNDLQLLAGDKKDDLLLQDMKKLMAIHRKYDGSKNLSNQTKEINAILETTHYKDKLKEFISGTHFGAQYLPINRAVDSKKLDDEITSKSTKKPRI